MDYKSRLDAALRHAETNLSRAAKMANLPQTTVASSSRQNRPMKPQNNAIMARELGVSSRWLATGEGAMLEPDYTRHSESFQNSIFDPMLMRAVIANGVRLASQDQFIANEGFAEKLILAYQDAQENLELGLFEDFADAAFAATKAQFKTFPH